jgi:hypothetical protein
LNKKRSREGEREKGYSYGFSTNAGSLELANFNDDQLVGVEELGSEPYSRIAAPILEKRANGRG